LLHRQDPIDALGGFNELTQHLAAEVAAALGLPYHSPAVIRRTRDKAEMRRTLQAAGVDSTAARLVHDGNEVAAFGEDYGFPIVLKPVDGRASSGVSIIRSHAEIPAAIAWFEQGAAGQQMLAEQFLAGEEWSVESFSEGGQHHIICVTQKFKDPQTSVETGHCLPAPVTKDVRSCLEAFVHAVLNAIGLENGPSHTEVILTADGPRLVETHARLGGDNIVDLIALTSGVDLDLLWIRQVAGEQVLHEVPGTINRWAAIAYATPRAVGTLERIEGLSDAREKAGIVRVNLLQEPGTYLRGASDSFGRGASAIALADDPAEAINQARAAVQSLTFIITCGGNDGAGS